MDYRRLFRMRFGRRADIERELEDEVRAHLEMRAEDLVGSGMDPDEARREAERRFGDVDAAQKELYDSARRRERRLRWGESTDALIRDLRLAFRRIRRAPGHSSISISILALGIALTTIMFAVVDHVLLRPLPFPEPDELVSLQSVSEDGSFFDATSMGNWFDWHTSSATLAATGIMSQNRLSIMLGDNAFRVNGTSVGGGFFEAIRPRVLAGRVLSMDDGQEINQVTVLSSAFARQYFGSPEAAVDGEVVVSGRPYDVVGVIDSRDAFPEGTDLWVAFHVNATSGAQRMNVNFQAIGRMRSDVDLSRADEELDAIAENIRARDPDGATYSYGVETLPLRDVVVSDSVDALWLLMIAVLGVLGVACANLAGLGLARTKSRAAEISVRMALGSGRTAVIRQLLVEYVGLAIVGGALGLGLAWVGGELLFSRLGELVPRASTVSIDPRVGVFTAAIAIASGLLAGVLPALRASKVKAPIATRGHVKGGRGLPGGTLVAAEVALALSILIGGGLLVRSLQSVVGRDLGFEPENVLVADVHLTGAEYRDRDGLAALRYWDALLEDLRRTPGIAAVGVAHWIPTGQGGTSFLAFPDNPEPDFGGGYRVVSDDYFRAMGMSMIDGRTFNPTDEADGQRVTVVNRAMAERAWPGQNPIGQLIRPPSMEDFLYAPDVSPWLTVIGVVEDVRHHGYEADVRPELYVLHRQVPGWIRGMNVVVRSLPGSVGAVTPAFRETIRASDPTLAIEIGGLDDRVQDLLRERLVTMWILTGFSITALLLTCLGIYGLVAHAASQRTREIAVRRALGAQRTGLLRLMLVGAGRVIFYGTIAGLAAAWWLSALLESLVIDVAPRDPITFVGAALVLAFVGMLAAFVPSAQAARLNPLEALRVE